ncbi:DUF3108 domain-containing protein [Candidatus Woesearchaeota archaeon]|nr:DUF3108 domain-containing protein [Candidatus Woesearchaeota archaeon]
MALENLLRKTKNFAVAPLVGIALFSSPLCLKNNDPCVKKQNEIVNQVSSAKTLESYTVDYDLGIYFLGIKLFSSDANFYFKKTEENGLVKEIMGAEGKYSEKYHGFLYAVISKDAEPFETHSYTMNYTSEKFIDKADFYKDKIVFTKDGVEHTMPNDGRVGLQSMIKPLYTEDLYEGQVFNHKTFLEGKRYECTFYVHQEETIKVKGKKVRAHYVTLKAVGDDFYKDPSAEIWVVKGKPHNKLVKIVLTPFVFTKLMIVSNP